MTSGKLHAMDGANELQILWHVVLPLSKPILLTIGLFYAVFFWNEFFTPILYLNDHDLMPLPVLLRNILISASFNEYVEYDAFSSSSLESLKAAGVLITMLPMLLDLSMDSTLLHKRYFGRRCQGIKKLIITSGTIELRKFYNKRRRNEELEVCI